MAKNGPKGKGRLGTVNFRSQFLNRLTALWQKRDTVSGRIADVKTTGGIFKGVKKEKRKRK